MKARLSQLGGAALLLFAAPALAATASGSGSTTVIRTLTVSAGAQMSFGRMHNNGGKAASGTATLSSAPPIDRTAVEVQLLPNGGETPAIRSLSGEPGRIYRVILPSSISSTPGGYAIGNFTVWSTNNGNITTTRLGTLGPQGTDTIRIGATITLPRGTKQDTFTANVPVTISYE